MASSNMDSPLCANGCGFHGSAANKNLCSKCYKDLLKEKINKSAQALSLKQAEKLEIEDSSNSCVFVLESSTAKRSLPSACDIENAAASVAVTVTASASVAVTDRASASEGKTKKKNRCKNCNKKVGLTGFECRCGDVFCGKHRYPEEHACKVNFKEIGRQLLAKLNPICKADKLESRV